MMRRVPMKINQQKAFPRTNHGNAFSKQRSEIISSLRNRIFSWERKPSLPELS